MMTTTARLKNLIAIVRHETGRRWRRLWSAVLPYRPMDGAKEVLDSEYARGSWDYLRGSSELPRFSVVAGYCHHFKPGGSILEIGCGEGILQERLDPAKYSRYLGVDLSSEAIQRASRNQDSKTRFASADARSFRPEERYDAIVFNEVLEYFEDPLRILERYEPFLQPGGVFIVSMFVGGESNRSNRIWKQIRSRYAAEAETKVTTLPAYTWIIKVFTPS
jgi:2-polyprenyl-3-methyl-5-hydroxy-6-metoxy-1,4-benzoquinol methylase